MTVIKKETLPTFACPLTNLLDNQNMLPTRTTEGISDKENFFVGALFDISNKLKNNHEQINTTTEEANTKWSVLLFNTNGTNVCYKINSGVQVKVILANHIKILQIKPRITKSITMLTA